MTTFLLVRHAHWDGVGHILAGRAAGTRLSAEGRDQAENLAGSLGRLPIAAVYTSPLERARETAAPLADRLGLELRDAPGLLELDFGRWTGCTIANLAADPDWRRFNQERGLARIPGGETMPEAVARARATLVEIGARWRDTLVAAVTHGDIIRGLIVDALGLPIERMLQLEVSPASVSVLMSGPPPRVGVVNWRPDQVGELPLGLN